MQLVNPYTTRAVPRPMSRAGRAKRVTITPSGLVFLKAAIAPRDFPGLVPPGVPDRFGGPTFVMQHQLTVGLTSPGTSNDFLVCALLPCMPSCLWTITTNAITKTASWAPHHFPSVETQIFGDCATQTSTAAPPVASARVLGGTMEIIPTSAPALTPGVVFCTRIPVRLLLGSQSGGAVEMCVSGLEGCAVDRISSGTHYSGPLANGLYTTMVATDPDWAFRDVITQHPTVPIDIASANDSGILSGHVCLFDETMMATVALIPYTSGGAIPIQVSVTAMVEYLPRPGNLLAALAHQSPDHDPVALTLYEKFAKEMPIAVPAFENAGFWERFLRVLEAGGSLISLIPGPVGMIGRAVGVAAGSIASAIA